jgi:hypothetical protein
VQVSVALQETASRLLPVPLGSGMVGTVHVSPSQTSASVASSTKPSGLVAPYVYPTAVQSEGDVHDTPFKYASRPATAGVAWTLQVVPFRVSANGSTELSVALDPTAVQAVAKVQETASSELPALPIGVGVVWTVQAVPFQNSANGSSMSSSLTEMPTAVQAVGAVQETPVSEAYSSLVGGVDSEVQVLPFQFSARSPLRPSPV